MLAAPVWADPWRLSPPSARLRSVPTRPHCSSMNEVTRILSAVEQGDPQAAEQSCRSSTTNCVSWPRSDWPRKGPARPWRRRLSSMTPTYGLVDVEKAQHWNSRGHFFAAAAEAMRRLLIESVRRKQRPKYGGGHQRVDLNDACWVAEKPRDELLDLDHALQQLAAVEPIKAELVKLHYFAGLSLNEAAACLGISLATAKRYWAVARAWLYAALSDAEDAASG